MDTAEDKQGIARALDLRAFLNIVKAAGELKEISGAHWKLEIGALTELFAVKTPTPALLFDNIPGHGAGKRVLSNVLFSPRDAADAADPGEGGHADETVRLIAKYARTDEECRRALDAVRESVNVFRFIYDNIAERAIAAGSSK